MTQHRNFKQAKNFTDAHVQELIQIMTSASHKQRAMKHFADRHGFTLSFVHNKWYGGIRQSAEKIGSSTVAIAQSKPMTRSENEKLKKLLEAVHEVQGLAIEIETLSMNHQKTLAEKQEIETKHAKLVADHKKLAKDYVELLETLQSVTKFKEVAKRVMIDGQGLVLGVQG